jgi:hypothetical protein
MYIVTWHLKAGIVEIERKSIASQRYAKTRSCINKRRGNPLLGSGSVSTFPWKQKKTQKNKRSRKGKAWLFIFGSPRSYKELVQFIRWRGRTFPCGGGIEYLHRDPASRRRRRKGKSQIWDSNIWSRVPRDSDQRMIALCKGQQHIKKTDPSSRQRGRRTRSRP